MQQAWKFLARFELFSVAAVGQGRRRDHAPCSLDQHLPPAPSPALVQHKGVASSGKQKSLLSGEHAISIRYELNENGPMIGVAIVECHGTRAGQPAH